MNQTFQLKGEMEPVSDEAMTSERGRAILRRIQEAMSRATLEKISPNKIRRMVTQPRKTFNQVRLQMLANSIRASGQMMPGIIRRISKDSTGHEYELCDGERRYRAVIQAEVPYYRAMVVDIDDEAAQYVISIISNFNRDGHTLLELVDSVVRMHDELKLTIAEVAQNLSLSAGYVQNLYGLRRLDQPVRDMLDPNLTKKPLPMSAAVEISALPPNLQLPLAQRVLSGQVKRAGVHREVVKIARTNNLAVRELSKSPSKRRAAIQSRVETVHLTLEELQKNLKEVGASPAVSEWPDFKIRQLQTLLGESGKILLSCHEILQEELEKKYAKIIRPAR